MACPKRHGELYPPRGTVRVRSRAACALVAAAMDSCKVCRWNGTRAVAEDLSPSGVMAELYASAAEHATLATIVEGREPGPAFTLDTIRRRGGVMCWPPTPATWALCTITVRNGHVGVDTAPVLEHLATLDAQDRAWVADDCLDVLVGAEFYPSAKIATARDRHLAASGAA